MTRINEDNISIALDLVGLIPGVGEIADIANAVRHAKRGEYLFAALSILSVIPAIGDLLGKGGKLTVMLAKKFPKGSKNAAKLARKVRAVKVALGENRESIDKVFDKAEENEKVSKHVPQMRKALNVFMGDNVDEAEILLDPWDNLEEMRDNRDLREFIQRELKSRL